MLSKVPIDISSIKKEDLDKEILRAAIIAELDAINVYEEMAGLVTNEDVKTILLDVAREEKTHIGEFQALLLELDPEQGPELEAGKEEGVDALPARVVIEVEG